MGKPNVMTETTSSFDQLISHPLLLENLTQKMGFKTPTKIQEGVAAPIREGKNLFAGAKTGSGKTVAFLAPIAERLLKNEAQICLVLAPTRELVLQIDEEAMHILDGQTDVVSVPLYGGVPTDPQILALRVHKPRILIATPGRILDLIQEGCVPLNSIDIAVLDEADRMSDMGFAPQVQQILDLLIARKQTLLFSATLPKEVNEIMERFCPNAFRVQVDAADESSETIQHQALFVSKRDKIKQLISLLEKPEAISLVFTRTRNRADELYRGLSRTLKKVGILHAGFSMPERERTIRDFREGKIQTLIATDVVARGIDVDRITQVIHYDLPDQLEDYIHRSGRSGRAGRAGSTIALVDGESRDQLRKIEEFGKKIKFQMSGSAPSHPRPQMARDQSGRRKHSVGHARERHASRSEHGERKQRQEHPRSRSQSQSSSRSHGSSHSASHSPSHGHGHGHSHGHSHSQSHSHTSHSKPHKKTTSSSGGLISKTKRLLNRVFGGKPKK